MGQFALSRAQLVERMAEARRKAPPGTRVALFVLGLNGFRTVNHLSGHDAGDVLLAHAGARIQACVGAIPVTRLWGDEFAIVVGGLTGKSRAAQMAARLAGVFREPLAVADYRFALSASVGVAVRPSRDVDTATMLRQADVALHAAKREAKPFAMFSSSMTADLHRRVSLEEALREAIEQETLALHYQAIVRAGDQAVVGAEALTRWRHPILGIVGTDEIIRVAEQTGLIVPLGRWALRAACRQLRQWFQQHPRPVRVHVNVSPLQLRGALADDVDAALQEFGVDPEFLGLELTETHLMGNVAANVAALQSVSDIGVALAIDDFGTGYSSLAYLRKLPVDAVKIDQSFTRDLATAEGAQVMRAIVGLVRDLDLHCVVEGVETEWQRQKLRALRVDEYQGFVHSRAVPAEEFADRFLGNVGDQPS